MKKIISIILVIVNLFVLCFTACKSLPPDNDIKSLYLQAVALGYEGTEEQFAAVISNDDKVKQRLAELEERLNELNNSFNEMSADSKLLQERLDNLYGEEIIFTAEKPLFNIALDKVRYAEFDHHYDSTVSFESFLDFYRQDIKPKIDGSFCLFAPITDEYDWHPNRYRTYSVFCDEYSDGKLRNPIIYESMMMYSNVLGDKTSKDEFKGEGNAGWNLDLKLCLVPIQNYDKLSSLKLEFGNNNSDNYWGTNYYRWGTNYINIYLGKTCIGTCYYATNTYISLTWFKNYFNKNLII